MNGAYATVSVASRMENAVKRLFPSARTTTIHNGAPAIPRVIQDAVRPTRLEGKTVVFSAGMFYERKGFPILIEAFAKAFRGRKDVLLRIAGAGDKRRHLEQAIRDSGMNANIELLGLLGHAEVLQQMIWSDVFALVGWDEPFATVYSEACSAGLPLVMCNDGGFNDVFCSGKHGIAVPPRNVDATAQALVALVEDPERTKRMGNAARTLWAERLSWESNAKQIVTLLAEASRKG
jgi:glycosyltransferase involved in cell wall biosynthesis